MKTLIVIPSRLKSTRLHEKPLISIKGKSLIERVYNQVKKCKNKVDIIVATDSEKIIKHAKSFGADTLMTKADHLSGTERCCEALNIINKPYDLVINVQGDEPLIDPKMIDSIITSYNISEDQILTATKKMKYSQTFFNENIVKVEFDKNMIVADFYRKKINYKKDFFFKHIGIYAFSKKILNEICLLNPTKKEIDQSLEQLRWLENNYKIRVIETKHDSVSIDTKEDIQNLNNKLTEKLN